MANYLDILDSHVANIMGGGAAVGRSQRDRKPRLRPHEEEALLSQLGSSAIGGIGAAGNVLDLPGSVIRDAISTLGGEWNNPFDQLLPWNWGSSEGRTTGRDLLRQWDVIGDEDTYKNFAGGMGLEMALDPLTYLTFGAGAATRAGALARKANIWDDIADVGSRAATKKKNVGSPFFDPAASDAVKLGKREAGMGTTLRDFLDDPYYPGGNVNVRDALVKAAGGVEKLDPLLDMPLRGNVGFNVPFGPTLGTFGTNKTLARYGDKIGKSVMDFAPVRHTRGLFDSAVKGKAGKEEQLLAELMHKSHPGAEAEAKLVKHQALKDVVEIKDAFEEDFGEMIAELGVEVGKDMDDSFSEVSQVYSDVMRYMGEVKAPGHTPMDRLHLALSEVHPQLAGHGSEFLAKKMAGHMDHLNHLNKNAYQAALDRGLKGTWLEAVEGDYLKHFPRYIDPKKAVGRGVLRDVEVSAGSLRGRKEEIRHIPAYIVNKMFMDPKARGDNAVEHIINTYGEYLQNNLDSILNTSGDWMSGLDSHAYRLKKYMSGRKLAPLFTNTYVDDLAQYHSSIQKVARSADAVHHGFFTNLISDASMEGGVLLHDAFRRIGMDPDAALKHFAHRYGMQYFPVSKDLPLGGVASLRVSEEMVLAAKGLSDIITKPEWQKTIGRAIDSFTNVFKAMVTLPFPAFYARNFSSGQFVNLASGLINSPADVGRYGDAFQHTARLMRGWVDDPEMLKELEIYGVSGHRWGFEGTEAFAESNQVVPGRVFGDMFSGKTRQEAEDFIAANPMAIDEFTPLSLIPDRSKGKFPKSKLMRKEVGKGLRRRYRSAVGTGAKVNQNVEFMNRVPMYVYMRRKGFTPEAAARKVEELHFNYNDFSDFEKSTMKKIMPFYSFSRKAAPMMARTIAERPGGLLGKTLKATARGHSAAGLTPDYVAETTSIPLGELEDGSKTYLTGLGLAHEDPLSFLSLNKYGMPSIGNFMREGASRLSPIGKAPLEWMSQQSYFQKGPTGGRSLDDLDPTYGRIASNLAEWAGGPKTQYAAPLFGSKELEFLLGNLPTSRFGTTIRQLTDKRKWEDPSALAANLFTGLRKTHISEGAQDRIIQTRIDELMGDIGARSFTKAYVPAEVKARMGPSQRELSDRLDQYNLLLGDRARKRKQSRIRAGGI